MRPISGANKFFWSAWWLLTFSVFGGPFADVVAQPAGRRNPIPVIRDSAGVRIVEYPTLSPLLPPSSSVQDNPFVSQLRWLPAAFRVDSKPYLDLGGLRSTEDEEFDASHPMLSATELANGTIVVNDRAQLKFFTSTGKFVRRVGRVGRGPAEFTQTMEVCLIRGNRLLVRDIDGRLSVWDANGVHVQTYARLGRMPAGGCLEDGTVIVQSDQTFSDGRLSNELTKYRISRPDGVTARELGRLPSTRIAGGLIFSPSIIPRGDELYVADARTYEVRIQRMSGPIRQITRLTRPAAGISDAEWRGRAERRERGDARRIAEVIAQKPSGSYPAYSGVRVDPKRRVWIQDYESHSGWTILDPSGVLLGRFELPGAGIARVQLVGVGADHIIVLQDDADGGVHLMFYRIYPNT